MGDIANASEPSLLGAISLSENGDTQPLAENTDGNNQNSSGPAAEPALRDTHASRARITPPKAIAAKNPTLRLQPSTNLFLRRLALRRSGSVSDIMREAIDRWLICHGYQGIVELDEMSCEEVEQLML